jgi:hypothetical protein
MHAVHERSMSTFTAMAGDVSVGGDDVVTLDPTTRTLQISCFGDAPPPLVDQNGGDAGRQGPGQRRPGNPRAAGGDEHGEQSRGWHGPDGAGGAGGNSGRCIGAPPPGAGRGAGGFGPGGRGGAGNAGSKGGSSAMGKVGERAPGATCSIPLQSVVAIPAVLDAVKACCQEPPAATRR